MCVLAWAMAQNETTEATTGASVTTKAAGTTTKKSSGVDGMQANSLISLFSVSLILVLMQMF
jgi:hypothetical protein